MINIMQSFTPGAPSFAPGAPSFAPGAPRPMQLS